VSIIEKIVHWFSPPEDTCVKGPTPEESAGARQEWRKAMHDNRHQVQNMQSSARETTKVLNTVNEDAYRVIDAARKSTKVLKMAEQALKELEKRRGEN
jgi:magnesium-transporting ATPase (P-type)